jgi:hypothetical protein
MTRIDFGVTRSKVKVTGSLNGRGFQLIILKDNYHKVFIFHIVIGHNQQMISIAFWVTRSKVKVTWTLNVRMVAAYYLEDFYHKVFIFHILIGHN